MLRSGQASEASRSAMARLSWAQILRFTQDDKTEDGMNGRVTFCLVHCLLSC